MFKLLQAFGVSLTVITAGLTVATAPAQAQGVELQIGPNGVRPVVRDRDRDRRPMGCSEREARSAARESGLRDPEVVRSTPSRIVVEGMTRRGPERITFANERGCPEL